MIFKRLNYPEGAIRRKEDLKIGKEYYVVWPLELESNGVLTGIKKDKLSSFYPDRQAYTIKFKLHTYWLPIEGAFIPLALPIEGAFIPSAWKEDSIIAYIFDNYWFAWGYFQRLNGNNKRKSHRAVS